MQMQHPHGGNNCNSCAVVELERWDWDDGGAARHGLVAQSVSGRLTSRRKCQAAPSGAAVILRRQLAVDCHVAKSSELGLCDDRHCSQHSFASTSTSSSSRHPAASCLELHGAGSQSHVGHPRVDSFTEDSQFQLDEHRQHHVGDAPPMAHEECGQTVLPGGKKEGENDARQNLVREALPGNAAAGTSARELTFQPVDGTAVPAFNGHDATLFAFLFAMTVLCVLHHLGVSKGSRTCCRSNTEYTPCEVWHDVRSFISGLLGAGLCYLLAARESQDIDDTEKVQLCMCML